MPAISAVRAGSTESTAALAPAYIFGLRVDSTLALNAIGLGEEDPARGTTVRYADRAQLNALWPRDEIVGLVDRRTPAGRLVMSIDSHPRAGYRITAPGYGTHIVSPDGTDIVSAPAAVSPWRWQRLLFAQVLPLAATLQGLELFHASAVEHAGRALGFVATSGTGKSSIAAHLVSRGARYVADDVVALEPNPGRGATMAHPGPALASVHRSELQSLGPAGARRLGDVIGRSDKLVIEMEPAEGPRPLAAIYFLERFRAADFAIEEAVAPEPRLLLASTYISYLQTPKFLLGHLDACARIAEAARVFHVRVPPELGAGDVAAAIERHVEAEG
jgi:hypothetical protein